MKRKLKLIFGIMALVLILFVIGVALFLNLSPQFGASKKAIRTEKVLQSPHFVDGVFKNLEKTVVMAEFKFSTMMEFFNNDNNKIPDVPLPVVELPAKEIGNVADTSTRITWFGHSTILVETAGRTLLIDPMLGDVPAPIAWAGSPRFEGGLPITAEELPDIDVVLISHDHYDHLDYGSIQVLKEKVSMFYTALGVGAHLRSWDVDPDKIVELDWWEQATWGELTFTATPARHFSGRGLFDRNCTQWASWIIQTDRTNIFFSGDGGYGTHFKEIGEKYGPFDFVMMECGQYNQQWAHIHMMPDEIPQAMSDLKSKTFMPIHWGAFKLALHPWTEPVEMAGQSIQGTNLVMATPKIGEPFIIGTTYPDLKWWAQGKVR
jgi:L-ascorbate metabolism protein UlaG (beta-lactamase superfamily)